MNVELLNEEMAKQDMSLSDLSRASGVSKSTISRILSGQRTCTVDIAKKLAAGLKLKPKPAMSIFFEDNDAESQQ